MKSTMMSKSLLSFFLLTIFVAMPRGRSAPFDPDPKGTDGNMGNEVLYYILVDRFSDGEKGNDIPDFAFPDDLTMTPEQRRHNRIARSLLPMTYDPSQRYMGLYWGGDLQGVIDKLDYLHDLGVTKLILSPIMKNAVGYIDAPKNFFLHRSTGHEDGEDSPYARLVTSYHGYWTKDWFRIDPHFRNLSDEREDKFKVLRTLLNEAAKRGIGIILDITLNHTSPPGGTFLDKGGLYDGTDVIASFDPKLDKLSKKEWFNRYRAIDFSNPSKKEIQEGTLGGGMPDLNQDSPEVERYIQRVLIFWLEFNRAEGGAGISGFRVDAIKHNNIAVWKKVESCVLSRNPSAILLGEYFGGGYLNGDSIDFIAQTKFFSQYDFSLSEAARRFFAGDRQWDGRAYVLRELVLGPKAPSPGFIRRLLNPGGILEISNESKEKVSSGTSSHWAAFVENHDLPRLRSAYPEMDDLAYANLLKFLFVIPRVPLLNYGTEIGLAVPHDPREQGLFGIGGDPFNRPMMIFPGDPGWNDRLYRVTKSMIAFRKEHPMLRYGASTFLEPRGSRRAEDLFLLRSPATGDIAEAQTRILYAYSTRGGTFALDPSKFQSKTGRDVESGEVFAPDASRCVNITLEPGGSRVIVFGGTPNQSTAVQSP
jgi:glycosidase